MLCKYFSTKYCNKISIPSNRQHLSYNETNAFNASNMKQNKREIK